MIVSLLALALAGQPGAAPPPRPGLAAIDDASAGGIRDWYARDDQGAYLRDRTGRWYYARFAHRCPGILTDARAQFVTDGTARLDRSGRVRTDTMTCGIAGIDRSEPPVEKGR